MASTAAGDVSDKASSYSEAMERADDEGESELSSLKKQLERERQEFSDREDELIAHCQKLEAALEAVVLDLQKSHAGVVTVLKAEVARLQEENEELKQEREARRVCQHGRDGENSSEISRTADGTGNLQS
eukprot:TRINITY_DN61232_c0_g1_i1.p1 TRINITY_DN61232_c0_g1~~TRINITY_DN61232_c0_g1_i1.p1  ORF type:complete len:146 (+),score=43.04 TRINITY_DN61232_c0_g1_i1:50-439(+)